MTNLEFLASGTVSNKEKIMALTSLFDWLTAYGDVWSGTVEESAYDTLAWLNIEHKDEPTDGITWVEFLDNIQKEVETKKTIWLIKHGNHNCTHRRPQPGSHCRAE